MNNLLIKFLIIAWEILILPLLLIVSFLARFYKKPIDVGLGPEPLINNFYHKRALELFGYTAETFVKKTYFIIKDFDFKILEDYSSEILIHLATLYNPSPKNEFEENEILQSNLNFPISVVSLSLNIISNPSLYP